MEEELHHLCEEVRNFISESSSNPQTQEQQFNKLALKVFRFQFRSNLPYRRFCEGRGKTPKNVDSFGDIPAVPSSAFKELDLTVLDREDRTTMFCSSGTTAQKPSRHFHSKHTLEIYEESLIKWFPPFALPDSERMRVLVLTPSAHDAPHSSLAHMFETVRARFGTPQSVFSGHAGPEGAWEIDFEKVEKVLIESSKSGEPVLICGTAFSFVHFCDFLGERRLKLPGSSRVFETGGYKGRSRSMPKEQLHALITDRLSVSDCFIISEYGMSELSSQAYDRSAGESRPRLFRFPPWARTEIISPESGSPVEIGQRGLIRIFDLANVGSVLAVQTEDLGIKHAGGFELLGRAARAEIRGCSLMHL